MITQGTKVDQTTTSEVAREIIVKREREVNERERRVEEKERKIAERERRVEKQEHRKAGQDGSREDDHRRELAKIKQERNDAREAAREAVDKLGFFEDENAKLEKEVKELQKHLGQSRKHAATLEDKLNRREKDIKYAKDKSIQLEMEHGKTSTLLEARTSELKGAQSFLTTADSLSGAEVSSMVEGLNAEILQAAAFMVDSFTFGRVGTTPGKVSTTARTRMESILGPTVLRLLGSVRHCEDPLVVQIALQACMANFGKWAIAAWHLDISQDQSILGNIYSQMREAGMSQGSLEKGRN
jgi:hypothetical protein